MLAIGAMSRLTRAPVAHHTIGEVSASIYFANARHHINPQVLIFERAEKPGAFVRPHNLTDL
jgi:hypothetical protein